MRERRHDYHDRSPVPVRVYGRRTVEALGYSTFGLADHFVRPFAPLIAGQAVADATTTPAEHLNDFADRIAMVTERMGGARVAFDPEDLRKSPIVAVGSLDDVCGKLVETRARSGISYFSAPIDARPEVLAPVIKRLAGT